MMKFSGSIPDFGAIFMSNKNTKEECFNRKLFGLPRACADFVENVKAGVVLFLFEYEKRELYGVFEAVSDGAMDIVPHSYHSSGKLFPAQVQFSIIWNCHPLSEHDFRDAIKDNYYAACKFNFGLSKDQVRRLLWLFDSRKVQVQKCLSKKVVKKRRSTFSKSSSLVDSGKLGLESVLESQTRLSSGVSHSVDAGTSIFHHPTVCRSTNSTSLHELDCHSTGSENMSFSGSRSVSLHKETEHVSISSDGTSLGLEDYIPLYSPEHSDPIEALSDNFPKFKGLYSDTLDEKTSVFSRLDLASKAAAQEREENANIPKKRVSVFSRLDLVSKAVVQESVNNSRVDKSVHEIMEKVQQRHNHWRTKTRKAKEIVYQNRERYMNKRPSVFSRLKASLEATVQGKEVNTKVDEPLNKIKEMFGGKKKGANFTRNYDADQNSNITIQVEMIEDASGVEEEPEYTQCGGRMEQLTPVLDFKYEGEMLKTQCRTKGRDSDHGAVRVCLPEEKHKKRRVASTWVRNESSDVKTLVCDSFLNVKRPTEGNSAGKENFGSCVVSIRSDVDDVDDDENKFSLIPSLTWPITCEDNNGEKGKGLTDMDSRLGGLSDARDRCFAVAVTKPLKTYQRHCLSASPRVKDPDKVIVDVGKTECKVSIDNDEGEEGEQNVEQQLEFFM